MLRSVSFDSECTISKYRPSRVRGNRQRKTAWKRKVTRPMEKKNALHWIKPHSSGWLTCLYTCAVCSCVNSYIFSFVSPCIYLHRKGWVDSIECSLIFANINRLCCHREFFSGFSECALLLPSAIADHTENVFLYINNTFSYKPHTYKVHTIVFSIFIFWIAALRKSYMSENMLPSLLLFHLEMQNQCY